MSDIYHRIRTRREELGLTQEELAFRMGYKSKSSINKIEMGINDIPQSKVIAFAQALDTTTAYLMGVDEEKKMQTFAERIKHLRTRRGLSQDQLSSMLGISRSTIGMYETGQREPDFETCEAIADIFNVDMDYLIGRSDIERKSEIFNIPAGFDPLPPTVKIPLIGNIACGDPIIAETNIEDYIDAPAECRPDFALRCRGDSMIEAGISDGDIVYIKKQLQVNNGEIAAVRIGDEATLKYVYWDDKVLTLVPANKRMQPKTYSGEVLNEIHIEGKAVGFTHWI